MGFRSSSRSKFIGTTGYNDEKKDIPVLNWTYGHQKKSLCTRVTIVNTVFNDIYVRELNGCQKIKRIQKHHETNFINARPIQLFYWFLGGHYFYTCNRVRYLFDLWLPK